MSKQLKNFFKNYDEQMTPDVEINSLQERVSTIRQNRLSKRQPSSIKRLAMSLAVFVVALVGGLFIYFSNYKTHADLNGQILYDYLDENFSEYSGRPIHVERELASDIQIFFYQAKNNDESYLVVFLVSPKNYPLQVVMDSNIVLEITPNENNIGSFIVLEDEISLNLSVTINEEIYSKTIQMTFEK